jgi:GNAT superfamily N-acetyltransferase
MRPVVVRPGRPADLDAVREIERRAAAAFADTAHPDLCDPDDDDLLAPARLGEAVGAGALLVAECAGAPVGFALLDTVDGGPHLAEIDVVPEAAGRGVGSALLEAVVVEARRRGGETLTLTTFRDVPFNAPFYARRGFREIDGDALGPGLAARLARERAASWGGPARCAMVRALAGP